MASGLGNKSVDNLEISPLIPPRRGNGRRKMKTPFHPSEPGEEVGGTGGPTSAFPALEFWSLTEPREALASVSSNKLR